MQGPVRISQTKGAPSPSAREALSYGMRSGADTDAKVCLPRYAHKSEPSLLPQTCLRYFLRRHLCVPDHPAQKSSAVKWQIAYSFLRIQTRTPAQHRRNQNSDSRQTAPLCKTPHWDRSYTMAHARWDNPNSGAPRSVSAFPPAHCAPAANLPLRFRLCIPANRYTKLHLNLGA